MGRIMEMFEPIDSIKRFSNALALKSCFKCGNKSYLADKGYFIKERDFLDNVQRLNSYMGKYTKAKEPPYFKGIWFRSKFEKDIFVLFDY